MKFLPITIRLCCLIGAILGLTGCNPLGEQTQDEEREPHFLNGKSLSQRFDYPGASEAFEKALEVNPRSATAHFELGLLNEQRFNDHATAIYHYEKFLRLRPDSEHADNVRQRITTCKQDLARAVFLGPVTQSMQKELEQLTARNQQLTTQNQQLQTRVEQLQATLDRRAVQTNFVAPPTIHVADATPPVNSSTTERPERSPVVSAPVTRSHTGHSEATPPPASSAKSHTIRSGETLYSIAKKYGVSQRSLEAANPALNPKKMKVGQVVKIPSS